MAKRVTIVDIAAQVGVSAKTVSRVVNNDLNVSTRVREAVTEAIAALGYRPNLAARSLASAQSFVIALLIPAVESPYFRTVHMHLYDACRRFGYHLVSEKLDLAAARPLDEVEKLFREVRPAGVVLTSGVTEVAGIEAFLNGSGAKWAVFGARVGTARGMAVLAEVEVGEAMLAEHLWALGHRHIAVMRMAEPTRQRRGHAFAARIEALAAGSATLDWQTFDTTRPALEIGRQTALRLLEMRERPTAIFAFNDDIAAGVISTLLTRNVAVPREISVVGFDDSDIARAIWPALTTIRQPMAEMADRTVGVLVGKTARATSDVYCPVSLVVRESTAPAVDSRTRPRRR